MKETNLLKDLLQGFNHIVTDEFGSLYLQGLEELHKVLQ